MTNSWNLSDLSFYGEIETKEERERRLKEEELAKQMALLNKDSQKPKDSDEEIRPASEITTPTPARPLSTKIVSTEENTSSDASLFKPSEPSFQRKVAFGVAQEPTILRNVLTLGSAGIESLFSEKTYSEIAREKEARRQASIYKDFPEFVGREEDAAVMAGRMSIGLVDPVTFLITPLKLAKLGKMGMLASGAGIAATDVALREEALYGEVDPLTVGIGAALGVGSTALGLGIQSRFRKAKNDAINERQSVVTKDGVKKIPTTIGSTPTIKGLNTVEDIEKYERIGTKIAAKVQTEIKNLVRFDKNYGSLSLQLADVNSDIKILTENLVSLTKKSTKVEDLSKIGLRPNLPASLKKLKPKYDYKTASYRLDFDSDIDKALFIISKPRGITHKNDEQYIRLLKNIYTKDTGATPTITELRTLGRELRSTFSRKIEDRLNKKDPLKITKFNKLESDVLPNKRQINAYKASLDKATTEQQLDKLQKLQSKLYKQKEKISLEDLPDDVLKIVRTTWDELAEGGGLTTQIVRGLVYETVRPIMGGIAFGTGALLTDPNVEDDPFNTRFWGLVTAGVVLGRWQKHIQVNKYNIKEGYYNKLLRVFDEERDKVLKRSLNTMLKEQSAGTHGSWMQAQIMPLRKLGAKIYRPQGAEINYNAKLSEMPVEQAAAVMEQYFIKRSHNVLNNVDHADILAAGRILNNKGIRPDAKHTFLEKGDLDNAVAVQVAAELDGLQQGYIQYAKKAGVPVLEEDFYGFTQMMNPMIRGRESTVAGYIEEAFEIQNKNQKGSIRPSGTEYLGISKKKIPEAALEYLEGATQVRRQNIWAYNTDNDRLFFRNRLNAEEEFVMQAAKNLSKERVIFDSEARAFLMKKGVFVDDPRLAFSNLVKRNTKIVEFTRKFGAKGEGIQDVFRENKAWFIDVAKKNNMLNPDGSLPLSLKTQLEKTNNKVTDSLDAFFGIYQQVDDAAQNSAQRAAVLYGQSILATTKLEKVAIPSLGDLTQVMQNSGFRPWAKAEWKQIMKLVTGGNNVRYSEELAQNLYTKETTLLQKTTGWKANAQFDPSTMTSELSGMFIEAPTLSPTEFMRRFFELVQLGRITRHAREVAYDAGVMNLYDIGAKLSRKAGKGGKVKLTPSMKKKLSQLDASPEEAMHVASFKNADEAWETDRVAKSIMQRAGINAADRDALIPTVGNRRLFSQSQNPFIRLMGSFLSWAQAKSTQTNSLISRLEYGDHALALRMMAVLPIYAAVNQLRMNLMSSDRYRHPYEHDPVTAKKGAESVLFTGQYMPWYIDKLFNSARNMQGDPRPTESLYPIIGLINDLAKMGFFAVKGEEQELGVQAVETLVPFGEDIIGQTDIKATLKRRRQLEKLRQDRGGRDRSERWPYYDESEGRQRTRNFEGGAISEKHHVPNVNLVPSERVDKNTGLPYEAEMERLGFKDGLLVSIGVAPVSDEQISKFTKSLKKRKAKRDGSYVREQYGWGGKIKDVLKQGIKTVAGLPEKAIDGGIIEQSKHEQAEATKRLQAYFKEQGMEDQAIPSEDAIRNALNHMHLAEAYLRRNSDKSMRWFANPLKKKLMRTKEELQMIQYARPSKPFAGIKDSTSDMMNNQVGYKAANKALRNNEESSLNRIDTIVNSYIRKTKGERFKPGEDVIFYDHGQNKYY